MLARYSEQHILSYFLLLVLSPRLQHSPQTQIHCVSFGRNHFRTDALHSERYLPKTWSTHAFRKQASSLPAVSCRRTHNLPYNLSVHPTASLLELKCCHVHLVHVAATIPTTQYKDFRGFIQSFQKIRGKL